MRPAGPEYQPRLARRRLFGMLFGASCGLVSLSAVVVLFTLLVRVGYEGWPYLTTTFLTSYPSMIDPLSGGIRSALFGTLWLIVLTALFAIPLGVGAAVYLHEFAPRNRVMRFVELNIANLAGVPAIVYGILGLAVFVRWMSCGRSVLSGALTMAIMVMPVVVIAAREALIAVPDSIRQGAYALGASRWQAVWHHVLPAALPGILTGVILAMSRALGEAAPLLYIGAVSYIAFIPRSPLDEFTVLPIQIFVWSNQPQPVFQSLAAAAILVLLGVLLSMNALATGIRAWQSRHRLS